MTLPDADADAEPLHAVLGRGEGFGHRQPLEPAWRYLNALPVDEAEHAGLLDRTLLKRHYSDSLMSSDTAGATFVAPDVRALPDAV